MTVEMLLAEVQESTAEMVVLFEDLAALHAAAVQAAIAPKMARLEQLKRIVNSMHRVNACTGELASLILAACDPSAGSPSPPASSPPSPSSPPAPSACSSSTPATSDATKKPGRQMIGWRHSPVYREIDPSAPGEN